jgi:hypothetical protein
MDPITDHDRSRLEVQVRAMYEAAGLPSPVILERPEMPPNGIATELGTVYPYHSRTGLLVGVGDRDPGRLLNPDAARHAAAALAACADVAGPEPDPAELRELTGIFTEMRTIAIPPPPETLARAALRWMREREARDA